jgi:hypothetical protein
MRILIFVILMDFLIFSTSLIFVDNERQTINEQNQEYHIDRYGYYWKTHK